jgi:predicted methyltransferase
LAAKAIRCTERAFPCAALEHRVGSCSAQAMRTVSGSARRALLVLAIAYCFVACGGAPPPVVATTPPPPAAVAETPVAPAAQAPAPAPGNATPAKAAAKDPLDTPVVVSDAIRAIVSAKDRSDEDRKLDAGRRPAELLSFLGVAPGQRIVEIGSYQGYTAELLGRAVAPTGKVYAQDPADFSKFTTKVWEGRKRNPAMKNIVHVERPFEAPVPPDLKDLDAVVCGLFYHDMVWLKIDRAKMNASILRALKPGGIYFIYDHSAREGTGTNDAKTLHRIEEKVVRSEVESAGFKLLATASFLRHPEDKRDWDASDEAPAELRGTSDRFVLKFVKP